MDIEADLAGSERVRPLVSPGRCEAKGACVDVCPFDVFEIVQIPKEIYQDLNFLHKIKSRVHGSKLAATPNADKCEACGHCMKACPENAIKLVKVSG